MDKIIADALGVGVVADLGLDDARRALTQSLELVRELLAHSQEVSDAALRAASALAKAENESAALRAAAVAAAAGVAPPPPPRARAESTRRRGDDADAAHVLRVGMQFARRAVASDVARGAAAPDAWARCKSAWSRSEEPRAQKLREAAAVWAAWVRLNGGDTVKALVTAAHFERVDPGAPPVPTNVRLVPSSAKRLRGSAESPIVLDDDDDA